MQILGQKNMFSTLFLSPLQQFNSYEDSKGQGGSWCPSLFSTLCVSSVRHSTYDQGDYKQGNHSHNHNRHSFDKLKWRRVLL